MGTSSCYSSTMVQQDLTDRYNGARSSSRQKVIAKYLAKPFDNQVSRGR